MYRQKVCMDQKMRMEFTETNRFDLCEFRQQELVRFS
jgi:hypothetical protein